jgi:REP element-mobilizing transposase RayT
MQLSRIGEIVKECWEGIPEHFSNALLDEFVIMPNHMHGITILVDQVGTRYAVSQLHTVPQPGQLHAKKIFPRRGEQFGKPISGSLSTIIRSFKSAASKRIHSEGFPTFAWQSRFYEHIIRDGQDLDRIRNYIANNVSRWSEDNENHETDAAKAS